MLPFQLAWFNHFLTGSVGRIQSVVAWLLHLRTGFALRTQQVRKGNHCLLVCMPVAMRLRLESPALSHAIRKPKGGCLNKGLPMHRPCPRPLPPLPMARRGCECKCKTVLLVPPPPPSPILVSSFHGGSLDLCRVKMLDGPDFIQSLVEGSQLNLLLAPESGKQLCAKHGAELRMRFIMLATRR